MFVIYTKWDNPGLSRFDCRTISCTKVYQWVQRHLLDSTPKGAPKIGACCLKVDIRYERDMKKRDIKDMKGIWRQELLAHIPCVTVLLMTVFVRFVLEVGFGFNLIFLFFAGVPTISKSTTRIYRRNNYTLVCALIQVARNFQGSQHGNILNNLRYTVQLSDTKLFILPSSEAAWNRSFSEPVVHTSAEEGKHLWWRACQEIPHSSVHETQTLELASG